MSDKCYSPNWEGGMDVAAEHNFDKDGNCILCGEAMDVNAELARHREALAKAKEVLQDIADDGEIEANPAYSWDPANDHNNLVRTARQGLAEIDKLLKGGSDGKIS